MLPTLRLAAHDGPTGNGRVSRLLLLKCSATMVFEVGRYVSLERLIEENKDRCYETLEQSSQHWREGTHDPWSYINYILFIPKSAHLIPDAVAPAIELAVSDQPLLLRAVNDGAAGKLGICDEASAGERGRCAVVHKCGEAVCQDATHWRGLCPCDTSASPNECDTIFSSD